MPNGNVERGLRETGEPDELDEKEKEVSEMIEHIRNNEALLEEVREKMKDSGKKDLEEALKEFAEEKIEEHKKTYEGAKERYQ